MESNVGLKHNVKTYDQKAVFSAYTASPDETDSNPCLSASGDNICERVGDKRICATRLFPLTTIIDVEGIGICEVLDRTSWKYRDRIDILFPTKKEAFQFGLQELNYKILYEPINH